MNLLEILTRIIKLVIDRYVKGLVIAKVISVDKANCLCEVEETGSGYKVAGVKLLSVEDSFDKKFVIYPVVGSLVTVGFLFRTRGSAWVVKYSDVDEVWLRGDEFGGLVKVNDLVDRLNLVEGKLNALLGKWNSFCSGYAPGSPTTVGYPVNLTGSDLTTLTETVVGDIENNKVKHG